MESFLALEVCILGSIATSVIAVSVTVRNITSRVMIFCWWMRMNLWIKAVNIVIGSELVPNISRIQSLTFVVGIILPPDKLPDFPSVDKQWDSNNKKWKGTNHWYRILLWSRRFTWNRKYTGINQWYNQYRVLDSSSRQMGNVKLYHVTKTPSLHLSFTVQE